MRKIINKKTYNTETAKFIGNKCVGEFGQSDGYEEKLFQTKSGEYFMQGIGGPESPYPTPEIKVLTEQEATAWKSV